MGINRYEQTDLNTSYLYAKSEMSWCNCTGWLGVKHQFTYWKVLDEMCARKLSFHSANQSNTVMILVYFFLDKD